MDVISAVCPDFNSLLENVAHISNIFGTWCVLVTDDKSIIGSYVAPSDSVTGPDRSDPINAWPRLSPWAPLPHATWLPRRHQKKLSTASSTWKGVRGGTKREEA